MMHTNSKQILETVGVEVSDPNTPPERLRELEQFIQNGFLSPTRQLLAIQDLTRNPSTPADVLFRLGADYPDQLLENPIWAIWAVADAGFVEKLPFDTMLAIVGCETVGEGLLRILAGTNRRPVMVRARAAANPATPMHMLCAFRTQHRRVRVGLALNPELPRQWQAELAQDPYVFVRQAIAGRTDADPRLLAKLAHDPHQIWIGPSVAANPRTPKAALIYLAKNSGLWSVHRALDQNLAWQGYGNHHSVGGYR